MMKTLTTLAAVGALALTTVGAPTTAEARKGRIAAGVIGGFAAGAIVGAALAPRYYYEPGPYAYYGPDYAPNAYYAPDGYYGAYAAYPTYPSFGFGFGSYNRDPCATGCGGGN